MSEYLEFSLGGQSVLDEQGELVQTGTGDRLAAARLHREATALAALAIALDGQTASWGEIKEHPAIREFPLVRAINKASRHNKSHMLPSPGTALDCSAEDKTVADPIATGPMAPNVAIGLGGRFPDYVTVEGAGRDALLSMRSIGISVALQTKKEARQIYLENAEREKIHLYDHKGMKISCGERSYMLVFDQSDQLYDRQAAVLSARMMMVLKEHARHSPHARYIKFEQLAMDVWESMPPIEKAVFLDQPASVGKLKDVFSSAISGIQHELDEKVSEVFTRGINAVALNHKLDPEEIEFALIDEPIDEDSLMEIEDGYYRQENESEGVDLTQLPDMVRLTQALLLDQPPATHQDAILLLDVLMSPNCRNAVQAELASKLRVPVRERGHELVMGTLGYYRYCEAVKARTIKGLGFSGRVMQVGGSLDGSKTLKQIGEPDKYHAHDRQAAAGFGRHRS